MAQVIKTHARRKILTYEPLQSLILDVVTIQLHVPRVYYEIKGGDKQEVPLPLDPETIAHILEPKYHTNTDRTTFVLLSIYFFMTLDYFHVIQKAVKKRIQHLQEKPYQLHPINIILSQFKTTGISRQTQMTPDDNNINNNSNSNSINNNNKTPTNPAQPQNTNSSLHKQRKIEFPVTATPTNMQTTSTPTNTTAKSGKTSVFHRLGRRPRSPEIPIRIHHKGGEEAQERLNQINFHTFNQIVLRLNLMTAADYLIQKT